MPALDSLRGEGGDLVAAQILGDVKGDIGFADERGRVIDRGRVAVGHPDAATDVKMGAAGLDCACGYGLADAFGLPVSRIGAAPWEDDEELLATVASEGIVTAQGRLHAAGGFAQDGIACLVAAGVVDLFETVEIGDQDGERLALAAAARELVLKGFEDRGAIVQSGEGIVGGLDAERFAGAQQLFLKVKDAAAGAQADAEFVVAERFGEVIVGAGIHGQDEILGFGAGGQKHDIGVGLAGGFADAAADFDSIQARHHPIEDCEAGGILGLENVPGRQAVADGNGGIAPFVQDVAEHGFEDRVVLGDENPQGRRRGLGWDSGGCGEQLQVGGDIRGAIHNWLIGRMGVFCRWLSRADLIGTEVPEG